MKNFKTIILAAGKGVRMQSELPKVLHSVCGKPIISYVVDAVKSAGSLKTYIVLGHKSEIVKKILPKDVSVVIQKKLLGTADAIKSAQSCFSGYTSDVLIVCGDTPLLTSVTIKKLIARHQTTKAAVTILTSVVDAPGGYGRIVRNHEGAVIAIREELDATDAERQIKEINVGAYCFKSAQLFGAIKVIEKNLKKNEFYLTDVIALLGEKDLLIETLKADDVSEGLGVNTREDLALTASLMRKKILRQFMEQGVTIVAPDVTYIDEGVTIGRDTVIRPFSVIEGNARIGKSCMIGPFCHIRTDSVIGDHVEVGNFAEISRAKLGSDSFMKHFSFLGDTDAGQRVNIGAGVVTANFDGKNKNTTKISDGAFIGSDSILIAPVKIGKDAMTAAGSIVIKGTTVPDKGIVMGIPARIQSRRK